MDFEAIRQTFRNEVADLLETIEEKLLLLEKDPDDIDSVHSLFRAVHTIKGSAGIFDYRNIVSFTHELETFLSHLRTGEFRLRKQDVSLLLSCQDHLARLVQFDLENEGAVLEGEVALTSERLIEAIKSIDKAGVQAEQRSESAGHGFSVRNGNWHLSLRFKPDVLRKALDPLSFLAHLRENGLITDLVTLADAMPRGHQMDPEAFYLAFELSVAKDANAEIIESAFELMGDACEQHLLPPHCDINSYARVLKALPEANERLLKVWQRMGSLTQHEVRLLERAANGVDGGAAAAIVEDYRAANEISTIADSSRPAMIESPGKVSKAAKAAAVGPRSTIRVDAEKLDKLINLVGELVIKNSQVRNIAEKSHNLELVEETGGMSRLIEEVRDSAMSVRMVPIGDTFKRFERIVRDVGVELGKEIELVLRGGDTELDKNLVEKISDPLMHAIRNAIDHGIEPGEARLASGKPAVGTVELNARHDAGNIVVEITDDGKGFDIDAILAKAIERGLASEEREYSEREIFNFVMESGFSTAAQITNVSGRGVGMDVVRSNIESLRGAVEINSRKGQGTTIRITLPLTLAIIDGFLVAVDDLFYVIPLDTVSECVDTSHLVASENGNHFINLREDILPYLVLKEHLAIKSDQPPNQSSADASRNNQQSIVIVDYAGQRAGLLADRLLGEVQTVIKPLGETFANLSGISGATILGTGAVALILDIPRLIHQAQTQDLKRNTAHARAE